MPPDIQFMLGEMNTKLDMLISRTQEDRGHVEKLEKRIGDLEAFRWKLLGAATVLSVLIGIVVHVVEKAIA